MVLKRIWLVVIICLVILITGHVFAKIDYVKNLPDSSIIGSMPDIINPGVQDKIKDAEFTQQLENIIFAKINTERSKRGVTPLKRDIKLDELAGRYTDASNNNEQDLLAEIDKESSDYIHSIGYPNMIRYCYPLRPNSKYFETCNNSIVHVVPTTIEGMTDDFIENMVRSEKCNIPNNNPFASKFSIVGIAIIRVQGNYYYEFPMSIYLG